MQPSQMGQWIILEGREALGLSFEEACSDERFKEKAARYRGQSAHLKDLRVFARHCMGLPPQTGKSPTRRGRPPSQGPSTAAPGLTREATDVALVRLRPRRRPMGSAVSGLSSPLMMLENVANSPAALGGPKEGRPSQASRGWTLALPQVGRHFLATRPLTIAGLVAFVLLLPRLSAMLMAQLITWTIGWGTSAVAAAATAFLKRLTMQAAVWPESAFAALAQLENAMLDVADGRADEAAQPSLGWQPPPLPAQPSRPDHWQWLAGFKTALMCALVANWWRQQPAG